MIDKSARKDSWIRWLLLVSMQFIISLANATPLIKSFDNSIAFALPASQQVFQLPQQAKKMLQDNLPVAKPSETQSATTKWFLKMSYYLCIALALTGVIPVIALFIEHNLAGLHALANHFKKCKDYCPRVAVIIPAWNEAMVLEHTIHILLQIDYPLSALRIYIIDDGSTDATADILQKKSQEYPEQVFYVRKEGGGMGKAHAVNYGLKIVLNEDWAQAVLFIDADVSFKKDVLRRLVRHLADPEVGAVTGYIKVGNRNTNYITRSIGYEYIVSQSIARRAQNVLGVVACLAGGAQLHTRENILALGGQINTTTLAEDTYTTFATQTLGKKVLYEGNAFVYAEEPKTIIDVWKQRFRWARGNIQITKAFKNVWFRKNSNLGNLLFGIIWFCVILTPIIMILSAIGLVGLFFLSKEHSAHIFFYLASLSLFVYLYTTLYAIIVDRKTSRLSWLEGILYPGIISLSILLFSINPEFVLRQLNLLFNTQSSTKFNTFILLFMETWSAFCMIWAWLIFRLEFAGVSSKITNFLLLIVGYGPLLCAINLSAYIAEIKRPTLKWDKTEKITSKRIIYPRASQPKVKYDFSRALTQDIRREYRFLFWQILSLLITGGLFLLFYLM